MIWIIYLAVIATVISILVIVSRKNKTEIILPKYDAPTKIDPKDFGAENKEAIAVLFSSSNCDSCRSVTEKINVLESDQVCVSIAQYQSDKGKKLHEKYQIEAVPTVVICDASGVTQKAFLGSCTATDLWAAVAEVRGAHLQQCGDH